jgi:hypothetical protein
MGAPSVLLEISCGTRKHFPEGNDCRTPADQGEPLEGLKGAMPSSVLDLLDLPVLKRGHAGFEVGP